MAPRKQVIPPTTTTPPGTPIDQMTPEQLAAALGLGTEDPTGFKPGKMIDPDTPLGVPRGYVAPYRTDGRGAYGPSLQTDMGGVGPQGEGGRPGIGARYFNADLDTIAGLAPEALASIQFRLKDAGLLKTFNKGMWGQSEDNAMAMVFSFANRQGLSWEDALDTFAQNAELIGGAGGAAGPAFTARLSNPDDLKKAFTQSLYNAQGGRFMDDTQMNNMVDAYHQIEYGQQRAMFDNAGTVEDAPTAETFAATEAKKMDPAGVQAAKFADYGQAFEQLIGA